MRLVARRGTAAVIAAGILISALAGGAPAAADEEDGLWYYDLFGMQATHDSGITGEGVTIAVLDSQINPEAPALAGADVRVQRSTCYEDSGEIMPSVSSGPEALHATRVVSLIVGNGSSVRGIAPDATVLVYPILGPEGPDGFSACNGPGGPSDLTSSGAAVLMAVAAGADIISVSAGMLGTIELTSALATAQHEGVVILGAVANADETAVLFQPNLPASSNGAVGVQSIDATGAIASVDGVPNVDANTDVAAPGVRVLTQGAVSGGAVDWSAENVSSGTSFATPIVAGMLALVKQKYPDATGNQLVQSLIRNTGAEDHPLLFDADYEYGYGVASATHMLKVDPTSYDDVNPLLLEGDFIPSAEMVANPESLQEWMDASYGTSAAVEDDPAEEPEAQSGIPLVLILVIAGIGILVLAGAVTVIIVIAARRSRVPASPEGAGK